MAKKKKSEPEVQPEEVQETVKEKVKEVKPEVTEKKSELEAKKQSVREILILESNEVIEEAEKLIPRLAQLQEFARKNNRPHRHYFTFKTDVERFVNQFKRMLR